MSEEICGEEDIFEIESWPFALTNRHEEALESGDEEEDEDE